jgi:ABC-type transporter MlaC component
MDEYSSLTLEAKAFSDEISRIGQYYDSLTTQKAKNEVAIDCIGKLKVAEHQFKAVNAKIQALLKKNPSLATEKYFVKGVYQENIDYVQAIINNINKNLEKRSKSNEEGQESLEALRLKYAQLESEMKNSQQFENLLTSLTDAVVSSKKNIPFPECPKDLDKFPDFVAKFELWLSHEIPKATQKEKLMWLLTAVDKSPIIKEQVLSYKPEEGKYNDCMEALLDRYDVARVHALRQLEILIAMSANQNRDTAHMRKVHDHATSAIVNLKITAQKVIGDNVEPLSPEEITKLRIEAQCFKIIHFSLISRAISDDARRQFMTKQNVKRVEVPLAEDLLSFLNTRFINSNVEVENRKVSIKAEKRSNPKISSNFNNKSEKKGQKKFGCNICNNKNHMTFKCSKLLETPLEDRFSLIKDKNICPNCLQAERNKCDCFKKGAKKTYCKQCSVKHHDVLHDDLWREKAKKSKFACQSIPNQTKEIHVSLRPTAVVTIYGPNNTKTFARALIDSGAEDDLITYRLAEICKLKLTKAKVETETFTGEKGPSIKHETSFVIAPHYEMRNKTNTTACENVLVVQNIGSVMPSQEVSIPLDEKALKKIQLADPLLHKPAPIDMIIGTNTFTALIEEGLIKTCKGVLQNTKIGAIFMGKANPSKTSSQNLTAKSFCVVKRKEQDTYEELSPENVRRFFCQDVLPEESENFVQEFFDLTTKFKNGKYVVKLPLKPDRELGESCRSALAITRRALNHMAPQDLEKYVVQMNDMLKKGYFQKVDPKWPAKNYIASFAIKTKSPTTPVRMLLMCNQKTSNGRSINDIQFTGPKLQSDIQIQILGFRQYEYAVTGDLEKMFLQIKLDPEDAQYQHTFVPLDTNGKLTEVVMPTVIFGMSSSPFLANAVVKRMAFDMKTKFPRAQRPLNSRFFVDDYSDSRSSQVEMVRTLHELKDAVKEGGFHLTKIASNREIILHRIPPADCMKTSEKAIITVLPQADEIKFSPETPIDNNIKGKVCLNTKFEEQILNNSVNFLGIRWNTKGDYLHYQITCPEEIKTVTWRSALSIVGKIFDPPGFLSPTIMKIRMLVQKICEDVREKIDRNDPDAKIKRKNMFNKPVNKILESEFKRCISNLKELEKIQVPRWIGAQDMGLGRDEIIIFYDASILAVGYVAYLRHIPNDENDPITVNIIGSGGRVTPLNSQRKQNFGNDELTLPKAELNSAKEAADFLKKLLTQMEWAYGTKVLGIGDSEIAHAWMFTDPDKLKVFHRNRVVKIREQFGENLYTIDSKNNMADEVSRGMFPEELVKNQRFFTGPEILLKRDFQPFKPNASRQIKTSPIYSEGIFVSKSTPENREYPKFDEIFPINDLFYEDSEAEPPREILAVPQLASETKEKDQFIVDVTEKISDFHTTKKTWAKINRWVNRAKEIKIKANFKTPLSVAYSAKELLNAEKDIIRANQHLAFPEEFKILEKGGMILKGPLKKLTPFIDGEGILRVGGRIKDRVIPFNSAHPMILQKLNIPQQIAGKDVNVMPLTKKILWDMHIRSMHGGNSKMKSFLATKYYVLNAEHAIKFIIKNCVKCAKFAGENAKQLMGNIPRLRMTPSPPFYLASLDYAGPFGIVSSTRRRSRRNMDGDIVQTDNNKAWVCVFCDLFMGAIALEIVEDLSVESFMKMFKRFVGERGLPKYIYCDNFSTFKNAQKIFRRGETEFSIEAKRAITLGEQALHKNWVKLGVTVGSKKEFPIMEFAPPLAPNFNGRAEAAVKQLKRHLIPEIYNKKLTAIELQSILKSVQGILNTRPLCTFNDEIITPGHFLGFRNFAMLPEPINSDNLNLGERYYNSLKIIQKFTKMFSEHLINQMLQIQGKLTPGKNLHVGEIVMMCENNTPSYQWRLARIEKLIPGDDKRVRVVEISDSSKTQFERSVRQLVKLPIPGAAQADDEDSSPPVTVPNPKTPPNPDRDLAEKKKKRGRPSKQTPRKEQGDEMAGPSHRTVRRSPRFSKSRINMFSYTFIIVVLALFGLAPSAASPMQIHQPTVRGISYFNQHDVMLTTGSCEILIETGRNKIKDTQTVGFLTSNLTKACLSANERLKMNMDCEFPTVYRLKDEICETIEITPISTRSKRNSEHGKLVKFLIWLFWSDEDNADQSTPMGVVQHAVSDFQTIEKELQEAQAKMQQEVQHTFKQISQEDDKIFRSVDENAVKLRVSKLKDVTIENLHRFNRAYQTITSISVSDTLKIQKLVQQQLPKQYSTPNVSAKIMLSLLKTTLINDDGKIMLRVIMPVIRHEIFKSYFVIPVTDSTGLEITDIEPHTIIINEQLNAYLDSATELTILNATLAITAKQNHVVHKVTSASDCVVNIRFERPETCPVRKLEPKHELWINTPVNNLVYYAVMTRKELVCGDSRKIINENSGFIMIPTDCHIDTESRQIWPSLDKTNMHFNNTFNQLLEVTAAPWIEPKLLSNITFTNSTTTINDTDLDVVLKEAVEAQKDSWFDRQKYFLAAVLIIALVVVVKCWVPKRRTPDVSIKMSDLDNQWMDRKRAARGESVPIHETPEIE